MGGGGRGVCQSLSVCVVCRVRHTHFIYFAEGTRTFAQTLVCETRGLVFVDVADVAILSFFGLARGMFGYIEYILLLNIVYWTIAAPSISLSLSFFPLPLSNCLFLLCCMTVSLSLCY